MDNPCATRTHDWGTDPSTGRPRCQRCWLFGDHPASVSEPAVEEALDVTPQYARAILRNTIASLRGVVASKKTEIAVQQGDLEAQHRSIESLRKQLATAEADRDALKAEVELLYEELRTLRLEDMSLLSRDHRHQKDTAEALRIMLKDLQAERDALRAENERLLWPLGKNICPMCRKKVRGADDLHTCYDAYDAVCSQLAAAEARGDADDAEAFRKGHAAGFRAAADFVAYCRNTDEDGDYGDLRPIIHTLRAEADRREGSDE